jgi:hypothetical protein
VSIRATVYLISNHSYLAGKAGDLETFETENTPLDLDKAWHAISYLITGLPQPEFLADGIPLPDISEDAIIYAPQDIAALSQRLNSAAIEDIEAKFSAAKFNEMDIYPTGWDDSGLAYIRSYLVDFIKLIHRAAEHEKGLFVLLA